MEIKIDLNDILTEEYGSETLQESIKRQVVEQVANETRKEVKEQIKKAVDKAISEQIVSAINGVVESGLDEKFVVTDKYGVNNGTTSLREVIRNTVKEQAVYKVTAYSNDKNQFSRSLSDFLALTG
jgi:glutamyl/glutaminyl-tRNA synthetase